MLEAAGYVVSALRTLDWGYALPAPHSLLPVQYLRMLPPTVGRSSLLS